jgi:hypothetical protein
MAGAAQARTETVRWSQAMPELIADFQISWGISTGNHPNVIDVGRPTPVNGIFEVALEVPDASAVYVVARSRDTAGYYSEFSNERRFDPDSGSEPPPGESNWTQDFEGAPLGTAVEGWVDTDTKNSLAEKDSLFEVVDFGGNRVMSTSSGLINIHSHLTGGLDWSNYELRGRMRVEESTGSVGVTAYSAYPQQDIYYKLFRIGEEADSSFWIVGHPEFECASSHTGVTPVEDAWYHFRFEVASGTTQNRIRARVWPDGTTEPAVWQAICYDTSPARPTSGTIGLWSRGPGRKYWDDLEVVAVPGLDEGGSGEGGQELGAPGQPFVVSP